MIDSYENGRIVVDGVEHTSDLIIFPDTVEAGWTRQEEHTVVPEDLLTVFKAKPQMLIIGTGNSGQLKISQESKDVLVDKKIQLLEMTTDQAWAAFNELSEYSKTVGAFYLAG